MQSAAKDFDQNSTIAVTDSGLGGLSVLVEAMKLLPHEHFVYLADQAFMPYGDKPQAVLLKRLQRVADFLAAQPAKAIVLACNTATAAAAREIRARFPDRPIVGIEPAVKPAAMLSQTGRVGILATANTLASDKFALLVSQFESVAKTTAQPCPGLVELIEQQPRDNAAIRCLLAPRVSALLENGVDVIVLGCTHYPFVREVIQELAGEGVQVVETGLPVARQLARRLEECGLSGGNMQGGEVASNGSAPLPWRRVRFLTTGKAAHFKAQLVGLLGAEWSDATVERVEIDQ